MTGKDPYGQLIKLLQAHDWPRALSLIEASLAHVANPGKWLVHRAQCLMAMARPQEARTAALDALQSAAGNAPMLDAVASVFSFLGDQVQALQAYNAALVASPDNPQILYNRATVLRFLGDLQQAESDYDRVIALRPDDFEAYKNRSDLRKQTPQHNHVAELERLIERGFPNWPSSVQVRYAAAKECEDLGEYDKAFAHLANGAAERRRHIRYDVSMDLATVEWIIEAYPAALEAPSAQDSCSVSIDSNFATAAPLFIIGLPRSGTTLVERILGSHSRVRSAGELNDMALCIVDSVRSATGVAQMPRRELVQNSAKVDFAELGRNYVRRAQAAIGWLDSDVGKTFSDKMPLNYLYCGLIHRALPHARIIHLTRHPMAACYAMYKTLFKDAYPFSYDLQETGRYYVGYRRLMDHWRRILPGVIHEMSYESLVADQLGESRRLLDFCGLPWEEACAEFYLNPSASTTASAAQVRQPIYDSSVQQWRHYERQLEPLRAQLRAAELDVS